ncbi:MAG: hypothetical protein DI537_14050 [Stutzerimonas stutzeri]|nr:MAG: hypothetical protein DI537_14050 [Stutzerimonas stutzeri]
MTAAEKEFRTWCARIGLKPEHWGQIFESNGKFFRISGLKVGAPKYDLLADEIGGRGRTFKFEARSIAPRLETKKAA